MCSFEGDFIAVTDFLNEKNYINADSKTSYKTFKSLNEFVNDIPNISWSTSSRKIKIMK